MSESIDLLTIVIEANVLMFLKLGMTTDPVPALSRFHPSSHHHDCFFCPGVHWTMKQKTPSALSSVLPDPGPCSPMRSSLEHRTSWPSKTARLSAVPNHSGNTQPGFVVRKLCLCFPEPWRHSSGCCAHLLGYSLSCFFSGAPGPAPAFL